MAKTIWKFEFGDAVLLTTPPLHDPRVVLVAQQDEVLPTVWVEHGGTDPAGQRLELVVVGTGHPIPPGHEHMGSAVCGGFVWHIYGVTVRG